MKKLFLMCLLTGSILIAGCQNATELKAIEDKDSSPTITKSGAFVRGAFLFK